MVQGQVTLKGGGGLAIFLFNFFKPERNLEKSDNWQESNTWTGKINLLILNKLCVKKVGVSD